MKTTPLNDDAQPVSPFLNEARRVERDLSELLGLAKAMLCDGDVQAEEAMFLQAWGRKHPDAVKHWPTKLIFARLSQHFTDGRIDEAERRDLHELLVKLVGGEYASYPDYEAPTTLPLDDPAPLICWGPDKVYVFTGKFAWGTRATCEREVTRRGGTCAPNITRHTSFVVIGTFGSRDWVQTSFGRKIQHAVNLRDSGCTIRIVGEDHWATALALTPDTHIHPSAS